MAKRKWRYKRT